MYRVLNVHKFFVFMQLTIIACVMLLVKVSYMCSLRLRYVLIVSDVKTPPKLWMLLETSDSLAQRSTLLPMKASVSYVILCC